MEPEDIVLAELNAHYKMLSKVAKRQHAEFANCVLEAIGIATRIILHKGSFYTVKIKTKRSGRRVKQATWARPGKEKIKLDYVNQNVNEQTVNDHTEEEQVNDETEEQHDVQNDGKKHTISEKHGPSNKSEEQPFVNACREKIVSEMSGRSNKYLSIRRHLEKGREEINSVASLIDVNKRKILSDVGFVALEKFSNLVPQILDRMPSAKYPFNVAEFQEYKDVFPSSALKIIEPHFDYLLGNVGKCHPRLHLKTDQQKFYFENDPNDPKKPELCPTFMINSLDGLRDRLKQLKIERDRLKALVTEEEKGVLEEALKPLSAEEEIDVSRAFASNDLKGWLKEYGCGITAQQFQTLGPRMWLIDSVTDRYFELLKERENREPKRFLKCHFYNVLFYSHLCKKDAVALSRCADKEFHRKDEYGYSLTECDRIFVPMHKNQNHFALVVIDNSKQKFQYFDSLVKSNMTFDSEVGVQLTEFYAEYVRNAGVDFDINSWRKEVVLDLPRQDNCYDCGVFVMKYVDFISRGIGLCFTKEHMSYFRRRTALEILRQRAN